MTDTVHGQVGAERYPLRNSTEIEDRRLARLEALSDPGTIEALEALGVGDGWWCAELGAGRGSIVEWLARRVGPRGRVTAVDRDTIRLTPLASSGNVEVVEADLCQIELPPDAYHLVHSRSVLMHLACPDHVVAAAVAALRPGGVALFEESDGAPAVAWAEPPAPYASVMLPIVRRWTWARGLPTLLASLGMTDIREDVVVHTLAGCTPLAEFWKTTLQSVEQLVDEAELRGDAAATGFHREDLRAMAALLDDPDFEAPFTARHRVRARKPS